MIDQTQLNLLYEQIRDTIRDTEAEQQKLQDSYDPCTVWSLEDIETEGYLDGKIVALQGVLHDIEQAVLASEYSN